MKTPLLLPLIFLIVSACVSDETSPCSCPEQIVCTEEYRTITIQVKDQSGKPVALDDYYTTKLSTGEKINSRSAEKDSISRVSGQYIILEDNHLKNVSKCGEDFEFVGYKNDKEIVKRIFTIKNNCCHIELVKGDIQFVVNL